MSFNYGKEKMLFDREWKIMKEQYIREGMSDVAIQELYDYDWSWFRMRRVYENHVQMLPVEEIDEKNAESRTNLFLRYSSISIEFDETNLAGRYSWIETISDAELSVRVNSLAIDELELLTLIAIEGFSQREVARKMNCSQNAISKRLIKVKGILKKS